MRSFKGVYDPARDCIRVQRWFSLVRKKNLRWDEIRRVRIWGTDTVVMPKVGLDLVGPDFAVWLNEWDHGFTVAFSKLGLERKLPNDWYSQAETGELYDIKIAENSA